MKMFLIYCKKTNHINNETKTQEIKLTSLLHPNFKANLNILKILILKDKVSQTIYPFTPMTHQLPNQFSSYFTPFA
jgi:hypothetical protein